ncbi:MAG: hypothetical protein JSR73_12050 [Proteobacteria bacterium]|nr:hypothetical protein [Pseudomonadota bacterium]
MTRLPLPLVACLALLTLPAVAAPPGAEELRAMAARFAPVDIVVPLDGLADSERRALGQLVAAARVLDGLFLEQVAPGGTATLLELSLDTSALGAARRDYFLINKGPWSRVDHDAPFLGGVGARPAQAGFYPRDATRAEVEAWIAGLGAADRARATGFFTTVRRDPAGHLTLVPYSTEYQQGLEAAAAALRAAAAATAQPTLRDFLDKRAAAFLSNDYYASDVAWMDLDASLEATIGPYETYFDEWFNYKAAFEAVIGVVDAGASEKLARFSHELQWLEDHLPIEPRFRRPKLGAAAPIRVVNVVYASGDADQGIKLAAYNLPNDEQVVAAKGSKRVLLKNFQRAKFDHTLVPISRRALGAGDQPLVQFEPFFTHILMHELMHGLGPQTIHAGGRDTTPRAELKELYATLEEAKADAAGLWALQQLIDRGVLPKADERAYYVTYLASMFRTLRFGVSDAHARGMALQLNFLLDARAVTVGADGRFAVDFTRVRQGVEGLARQLLMLEAEGDYGRAQAWMGQMSVLRPQTTKLLADLGGVPVDIRPRFVTAESLAPP